MTLYRQYRPQQFHELVGQETSRRILQNVLARQRVAHAYLFSGPRGTGKTTTARIFARAVCCENPVNTEASFEPCNICSSCQAILSGHSTDFIEIDAASNRGIDDVRTLREQAQYPPSQLSRRVYIIDEAHMLTGDAFNALLKTLEEPPAHCLFILATTELHKLPITVRSRCQLIRFSRGSIEHIATKLNHIVQSEGWQVEEAATLLIAECADGGFRDAETLLEQLVASTDTLTVEVVEQQLGVVPTTSCRELVHLCLAQDQAAVQSLLASQFSEQSKRYEWILTMLINEVRQLESPTPLSRYFLEKLLEAYLLQRNSPVPSLPLEIACLAACQYGENEELSRPSPSPKPTSSAKEILSSTTLTELPAEALSPNPILPVKSNTSMDNVKVRELPPEPPQSVPVIELRDALIKDVRKAWKQLSEELAGSNLPLSQMVRQAAVHVSEGTTLTLHVRYKFHLEKLNEHKNRQVIVETLASLTGITWTLVVELNQSMPRADRRRLNENNTSTDITSSAAAEVFAASQSSQSTP